MTAVAAAATLDADGLHRALADRSCPASAPRSGSSSSSHCARSGEDGLAGTHSADTLLDGLQWRIGPGPATHRGGVEDDERSGPTELGVL